MKRTAIELVAPAGEPDAGYAALKYGADAVYAGLSSFSARAEAVNFTLDSLDEFTAYAHSLTPRRKVYVAVNTLVFQKELPEAIELIARVEDIGADGVIVQDIGLARIVRTRFPALRLHASTQMAIHNAAGAQVLADMGFKRVVLARELTLEEVRDATTGGGIETEVFIHGALCYSYSGLCLFSSFFHDRSGNRGRCSQPCRAFCKLNGVLPDGFAFSMKDLALGGRVDDLRKTGVSALKIEGRMKSPLYVATAVNYYRKLLDGALKEDEARDLEEQMQTVFARPWTRLYLDSTKARDVADADAVGHRGATVGVVSSVRKSAHGLDALRFTTKRCIEKHDGLQVDLPGVGRPFGFPVDDLKVVGSSGNAGGSVFEAPAGSVIEVLLPADHPDIPVGAPVYCSSSQEVKRSYGFTRPRPGEYRSRFPVRIELTVSGSGIEADAFVKRGTADIRVKASVPGQYAPAKDAAKTTLAAHAAFEKLGGTRLECSSLEVVNPQGLFVPVSKLNELRRLVVAEAEKAMDAEFKGRVTAIGDALTKGRVGFHPDRGVESAPAGGESWSLLTDRVESLFLFEEADWAGADEVVVDISRDSAEQLELGLARIKDAAGRERVRLALPVIVRGKRGEELVALACRLIREGWTRWQVSNLSALRLLDTGTPLDITADWPLYVTNRQSVLELFDRGIRRVTLSPDDWLGNVAGLLGEFGDKCTVVVHQDLPLFMSATCVRANLSGGKCVKCGSGGDPVEMEVGDGNRVLAISDNCSTVVIPDKPVSRFARLNELRRIGARHFRADFIWRPYSSSDVISAWRKLA